MLTTLPTGHGKRVVAMGHRLFRRRKLWGVLALLAAAAAALVAGRPHLRAWYHFRAARSEVQHYHNPQAVRHLRICREAWPRDPEVLLLAAQVARRARVYADTERLLRLYREVRGRDAAFDFEQLLLAAECRVDQVADPCWHGMEENRYNAPQILESLTRGYLRQYRLGQARLCLDRWRQMQPDNPQVFYLQGLFLLDYLHVRSAAVDSYRRAVEMDPDHEEARLGLAVALLGGKEFSEAAEHFKHLRQCQPDNRSVQVGLAECLDGMGETAEAIQLVDEVLAREPEFTAALALRGQIALQAGQLTEAENWLRQALRRKPWDHRIRYNLILCLHRNSQEDKVRREQQQLQQIEKDAARFNEIVTKDIAQRPTDPALHCTLGEILLRGGQNEEGVRWLQSALRLDPHYAPAQKILGDLYRRQRKDSQQLKAKEN